MTAFDQTEKESYLLVDFEFNDGAGAVTLRKTDWTSDEFGYSSDPAMEVQLPKATGAFDEEPANIALTLSNDASDFTQLVSIGSGFPPTKVTVREVTRSPSAGVATRIDTRFIGEMRTVRRNFRGNRGKIVIQCLPFKGRLGEVALGIPATQFCAHRLGDNGCGITLTPVTVTALSVSGYTMTTNQPFATPADDRFFKGYIQRGGLRINIRKYDRSTPTAFGLVVRPPTRWIGTSVQLYPGCDKTIRTCRERWSNEGNFSGYGVAIPAYNPVFETGAPIT